MRVSNSKSRERTALPIKIVKKNKFKDASLVYLYSKIKQKISLTKFKERRQWRSTTKNLKHSKSKLKETFSLYDKDGEGKVEPTDLGVMIRSLGGNPSEAQVNDIMAHENLSGPFDFQRFVDLMRKYLRARPMDRELHRAFEAIDNDDDGYIDVSKLRHILTTMGESLDPKEFDEWIHGLGVKSEGNVRYEDIIASMVTV